MTAVAFGGGDDYGYQWQDSIAPGKWKDISGATAITYQPGNLTSTRFFRVFVTSKKGCSSAYTSEIKVSVYDKLNPGTISPNQAVCINTDGIPISLKDKPTGSNGLYTYQWWKTLSGPIPGETNPSITPKNMTLTTYFKLQVKSLCGTDFTDSVRVLVNPLPDPLPISGKTKLCSNQNEYYSIAALKLDSKYSWSAEGGDIIGSYQNLKEVQVFWKTGGTSGKVLINETNVNGCIMQSSLAVVKSLNTAPNLTEIMRKPNSNILVTKENGSGIVFQWGFTIRATAVSTPIANSNNRFVLLPNKFDTLTNIYWLETSLKYTDTETCTCRTFYNGVKFITSKSQSAMFTVYPNPTFEKINVKIELEEREDVRIEIRNLLGRTVRTFYLGNGDFFDQQLYLGLPTGVYIMSVTTGNETNSSKIIIKKSEL